MTDYSQPLANARHEAFALAWAEGNTAAEAFRRAGYKDGPANAKRLTNNDQIKARRRWLQKQAQTVTLLTIQEKREFTARVVRAKLTAVPDDSDLWQEIRITEDGVVKKLPCKLKCIVVDNDLAGDGSEAGANSVLVTFAERLAHIRSHKKR